MRIWRKQVIRATLLFSAAGVMVETYEDHIFSTTSAPLETGKYREVEPPRGAAVCAVQFTHTIGTSFDQLQVFRLHYYLPADPNSLIEAYLAPTSEQLKLRAVAGGVETLSRDQKKVLSTLLVQSDPVAWEASTPFRQALER